MAVGNWRNLIEKDLFSSCQGSFVPCSVFVGAGLSGCKGACQRSSHQRLGEEQDLRDLLSMGVQCRIDIYCLMINITGFYL